MRLFEVDEPALVIECLNGYRLKQMPSKIGSLQFQWQAEILSGKDITIATYGLMCRVVLDAAVELEERISIEVIDVTLLPFDVQWGNRRINQENGLFCR
jgi:pyruvate/2-oxoglutarate/acetoin dehydrogenase E1 component